MTINRYLLQQDDCAPDSLESFIKEMKKKFGMDFSDFFIHGILVRPCELTAEWHHMDYVLSYPCGDDPLYILSKNQSLK